MDGFVALRPEREHAPLNALAAACVRKFDTFRASLSDGELRRRRQSPLNERQERMLQRWGYPYVMECFRFHITLTRRLEADEIEPVMMHLRVYLAAALHEPQRVDGIALCHQPDARTPFRVVIRIPLQGGGAGW